MSTQNPLKVTSPKEWRSLREKGIIYTFRSGFTARLRPVSIIELHGLGKIPETLISVAYEVAMGKTQSTELNEEQAKKGLNSLRDLIALIAKDSFIEPKVSLEVPSEEDEEHIWLYDITYQDMLELLEVSQAPAAALISFRSQQESATESV